MIEYGKNSITYCIRYFNILAVFLYSEISVLSHNFLKLQVQQLIYFPQNLLKQIAQIFMLLLGSHASNKS